MLRSILVATLCAVSSTALAEWQLLASDSFDTGPELSWTTEVRGSGFVSFTGGVMAMDHSTGWTLDPTQNGTLATLALALPDEYRITYRVRNTATCGWFYTRILQGPFHDFGSSAGYSFTTEYCGPSMFIAELPDPAGWHGTLIADWDDSHLGTSPGLWRNAEIIRKDGQISFYMEGETTLVATDPGAHVGGTLNFYAHDGYMTAEIDDLKIYARQDPFEPLPVTFGPSWDGISLQEILDVEYGAGAIDVATGFEGARDGDALVPYWLDASVDGWVIREVADFAPNNVFGWYAETLSGPPLIDGIDDGVIFDGSGSEGETAFVALPGPIRFGLYLNPNGSGDGTNAPEPEIFFTNRAYNDEGPDGSGAIHAPTGGDPQALIFNITHLRNGVPTYVVAWEDIDAGSELRDAYAPGFTDNDYNDLVVEIQASSPVKSPATSFGELKNRFAQ